MSTQQPDTASLEAYLTRHIKGFEGEPHAEKVRRRTVQPPPSADRGRQVLCPRRKPPGNYCRHMRWIGEYRVISACRTHGRPVPSTYLLCEDESVIGSIVLRDGAWRAYSLGPLVLRGEG